MSLLHQQPIAYCGNKWVYKLLSNIANQQNHLKVSLHLTMFEKSKCEPIEIIKSYKLQIVDCRKIVNFLKTYHEPIMIIQMNLL